MSKTCTNFILTGHINLEQALPWVILPNQKADGVDVILA